MTIYDAWIVCTPSQWDSIKNLLSPSAKSCYNDAITGFWKTSVYNVLGTRDQILEIRETLGSPPVYAWHQGDAHSDKEIFPVNSDAIIALMVEPASVENPNWGHCFFGQGDRYFAGDFSTEYDGSFY
jgi:hypothetical protein